MEHDKTGLLSKTQDSSPVESPKKFTRMYYKVKKFTVNRGDFIDILFFRADKLSGN